MGPARVRRDGRAGRKDHAGRRDGNNLPSDQERASLEEAAREELQADPNHARRINYLGIALFALGVSTQDDELGEPFRQFTGAGYAREPAYDLLRLGVQAFPDDRALTLNLALLARYRRRT